MNYLFFTDTHFHAFSQFSYVDEETQASSRLVHTLNCVHHIMDYCREHPDTVVYFLGDLFHARESIDTLTLALGLGALCNVKDSSQFFSIVSGNHDLTRTGHDITSFFGHDRWNWDYDIHEEDSVAVVKFPYWFFSQFPLEKIRERLSILSNKGLIDTRHRIIVGHFDVTGAMPGSCRYMSKDGIAPSLLESTPADLVLLGHYHKRQLVGTKIWYIGSICPINFADDSPEHGFLVVHVDGSKMEMEFINIEQPQFLTLDISELGSVTPEEFSGLMKGNYIKLRGQCDDPAAFIKDVREKGALGVISELQTHSKVEVPRLELPEGASREDLVKAYCAEAHKEGEEGNRLEARTELGLKVLKEALDV